MNTQFESNGSTNHLSDNKNNQSVKDSMIIESGIQGFSSDISAGAKSVNSPDLSSKNTELTGSYTSNNYKNNQPVYRKNYGEPVKIAKHKALQWFYNLPIKRKQLIALVTSEVLTVVGIAGVGISLIISSGRSQLVNQAKSELAVTELSYFIKINQMGFGFRGQSDNTAIIAAALAHEKDVPLSPALKEQVSQILKNEIKARKIEYATLVGKDLQIIVNANANRQGEIFNPNNLVAEVFNDPRQIKASAVVSWDELKKEAPPLPKGFADQDALIRYTVTQVKDPATKKVIGALVSGDIVNNKMPIIQEALKSFDGGYSAVYFRQPDGKFVLASSLNQATNKSFEQAQKNVTLANTSLLSEAIENNGEKVTTRMKINGETYTMSAQTLPNIYKQEETGPVPVSNTDPVAIFVRGTPETALNTLLRNSSLTELGIVILTLCINICLALVIGRSIATPIKRLQLATQKFSQGDHQARTEVFATDEIGELTTAFNNLADNIVDSEKIREKEDKQKQLLADLSRARGEGELTNAFNELLLEVRQTLNADRVVIYRFLPDWSGYIAGESVLPGWTSALADKIEDACIGEELLDAYRNGRVMANRNVFQVGFHADHLKLMQQLQVKSNLVVPIVQGEELFGLLVAHHCANTHDWQPTETEYLKQFANQLAQSLAGFALLERKQVEADRKQRQNEMIQNELLNLLTDVEGAVNGDLTVRAEITAGEIGIVADFFNAILENLREIVTEVKQSATQVNNSVGENEGAIRQLADAALKQASQITETLDAVEQMALSIQEVAYNAKSAAEIARTASTKAETGGVAMDRTVASILQLRGTVAETAKKVKRLGESSQQISKVISLINQIALKTNLLAVNASIEAARAGEEGRGFAVVAEEVGQLAAQSAAATKDIEQIVENIQRETSEVVSAMELGTTQVVEGTQLVEEAKQSLGQIVEVSRQIDQLLQSISGATVSQTQKSEIVTKLMEEIAKVSDSTSSASHEVATSLQETVAIAQQLQASVGTFKVTDEV